MATYLTQDGEEWIIDKLDVATRADYVGWGTGSGQTKASHDLAVAATEARIQGVTTQTTPDIIKVVSTVPCALLAKTITEAGLFTTAGVGSPPVGGIMVMYGDFTGKALDVGDRIEFTFTLEMT
jgi:hypothetical protein